MKTIESEVKKGIPFDCDVKLNNQTFIRGVVKGRKLDLPKVCTKYGTFEISWHLAYRLLNNLCPFVSHDAV